MLKYDILFSKAPWSQFWIFLLTNEPVMMLKFSSCLNTSFFCYFVKLYSNKKYILFLIIYQIFALDFICFFNKCAGKTYSYQEKNAGKIASFSKKMLDFLN